MWLGWGAGPQGSRGAVNASVRRRGKLGLLRDKGEAAGR